MQNLNLSDSLRYLTIGYVSIGLLYICDKAKTLELLENLGVIEISIFAFAFGSIIYLIYKPIIYHYFVMPFQDFTRKNSDNFRTSLKKRYNMNTREAMIFWFFLRSKVKYQDHVFLEKESSGIHLLYMSGFISLAFSIWQFIIGHNKIAIIILTIAIVLEISAFFYERFMEDFEFKLLLSMECDEVDELAKKLKFNKI